MVASAMDFAMEDGVVDKFDGQERRWWVLCLVVGERMARMVGTIEPLHH